LERDDKHTGAIKLQAALQLPSQLGTNTIDCSCTALHTKSERMLFFMTVIEDETELDR